VPTLLSLLSLLLHTPTYHHWVQLLLDSANEMASIRKYSGNKAETGAAQVLGDVEILIQKLNQSMSLRALSKITSANITKTTL
jgi:hypothetical protein